MQVNELTAITSTLTDLLGWQLDEYIYMSQIFNYLRPLIALPCAALIDRFGLRRATYLALALACLRNMSRMLLFSPHLTTSQSSASSSWSSWQEMKYTYWAGCMLCENLVVALYYSLPLKVSEDWFAQQERSIALSCMFILPTLGSASASLLLPHIMSSSGGKTASIGVVVVGGHLQLEASELGLSWLAALNFLAALLSIVVVLTTVTRSRPRQAPSQRSFQARENLRRATTSSTGGQRRSLAIWVNMRNLLTNFNLLLHMFARTTIDTLATTVNSLAQDVFASADLSQTFCGNFLALNGIFGALIQVLSSRYLDKKSASTVSGQVSDSPPPPPPPPMEQARKRTRLMRYQMLLVCLFFVMYLGSLSLERLLGRSHQWLFVIGCSLAYSFVWFLTAPFSNDLVADLILLKPVSQATVLAFGGAFYTLLINPYQMVFIHLRRARATTLLPAPAPAPQVNEAPLLFSTTTTTVAAAATKTEKPDYSRSMLFAGLVASSATLAYVTCFRAPAAGDQHFAGQPASEEAINDAVTPADNNNNNKACARCRSARPAAAQANRR